MGADCIVQSFPTVVVGGVGYVCGTLEAATMIGSLRTVIEVLSPSNALAALTCMILFIRFQPRGIGALRGRAA